MSGTIEYQYRDLLNPSKDPDKCFQIDIAQLLHDYVSELTTGKRPPNFNSAALLLQGSASIYGKKVEYLYNLANQLYHTLIKQKETPQSEKKTKEKDNKKADKTVNLLDFSTEIKIGKNLSVLRRKNAPKSTTKKLSKRLKSSNIPVLLLSSDDDKGLVFRDTRKEPVGNQGDYALNLCNMTRTGWLLLPTVNPNHVPSYDTFPEYYNGMEEIADHITGNYDLQTSALTDDAMDEGLPCSPDEGFSSGHSQQESTPVENVASSEQINPSMDHSPLCTDEGLGSTNSLGNTPVNEEACNSPGSSVGIENMPGNAEEIETSGSALKPIRQSVRRALKQCQLAEEDDPLNGPIAEKHMIVKKKIQKKNTRCLPSKLKSPEKVEQPVCISEYCARTFFWSEEKNLKNSLLVFDVSGFHQNSKFMKRMKERIDALKSRQKLKKKTIEPIEDEVTEVDVECLKDGEGDDDDLYVPFEDKDVQIDNEPAIVPATSLQDHDMGGPVNDDSIPVEIPSPDITHIAFKECEKYTKEVQQFIQNTDITERVNEWERSVKPFLEQMDQRGSFDINLYGSNILNSFADNNRKQTMTFKQFCKNKEKHEIHRYFMALLPLANIGNVSLEAERQSDGSDEIFVTLLSRKMHHIDLEEFGHNDGSHS